MISLEISAISGWLPAGTRTFSIWAILAASVFSFKPPMGSTRPLKVISPVMATLAWTLNELREAGLLKMESIHNSSRYEITREGEDTLSFFGSNISPAIVSDNDGYLKENKFRLRSEVGVISDFYKSTNQDYIVHCEVREGKAALISLDVSVPDKDQAEIMCGHWKERSQEIYSFVMRSLMRSE